MLRTEEKFWTVLRVVEVTRWRHELQKMVCCSPSRWILDLRIEPKEGMFLSRSRRPSAEGVYLSKSSELRGYLMIHHFDDIIAMFFRMFVSTVITPIQSHSIHPKSPTP